MEYSSTEFLSERTFQLNHPIITGKGVEDESNGEESGSVGSSEAKKPTVEKRKILNKL